MTAANESTATWASEELSTIASSDDLRVSPFREDGKTYGTPTWIWSVVVDDSLYVRAYNGRQSRWYQAALAKRRGGSLPQALPRTSYSHRSMARSSTGSTRPIGSNIATVVIWSR